MKTASTVRVRLSRRVGPSPSLLLTHKCYVDSSICTPEPYFAYYSSLQNQANMLSDTIRTTTYRNAILGNSAVGFAGKTVMDVGAGSGVLSFFAAEVRKRSHFEGTNQSRGTRAE